MNELYVCVYIYIYIYIYILLHFNLSEISEYMKPCILSHCNLQFLV